MSPGWQVNLSVHPHLKRVWTYVCTLADSKEVRKESIGWWFHAPECPLRQLILVPSTSDCAQYSLRPILSINTAITPPDSFPSTSMAPLTNLHDLVCNCCTTSRLLATLTFILNSCMTTHTQSVSPDERTAGTTSGVMHWSLCMCLPLWSGVECIAIYQDIRYCWSHAELANERTLHLCQWWKQKYDSCDLWMEMSMKMRPGEQWALLYVLLRVNKAPLIGSQGSQKEYKLFPHFNPVTETWEWKRLFYFYIFYELWMVFVQIV